MASNEKFTNEDFWASAYEGAAEESTGGGVIGKLRVDLGYKVYVQGMAGADQFRTFFPVNSPSKDARARIKAQAAEFAKAQGVMPARPQYVAALTMYKAECANLSGDPVDWQFDQQKTIPLWTLHRPEPSAAKVFMEALASNGAPAAQDFYGRVSWVVDPFKESLGEAGMTDQDQEGNARHPRVAIITEVYSDRQAALDALAVFAASAPDNSSGATAYPWADFPGEWGDDDWGKLAEDFQMVAAEHDLDAETYADDEFGEDLTWLTRVLHLAEFSVPEIADLTGQKKGAVKRAIKAD